MRSAEAMAGNADPTIDVVGNGAIWLRPLFCEGLR